MCGNKSYRENMTQGNAQGETVGVIHYISLQIPNEYKLRLLHLKLHDMEYYTHNVKIQRSKASAFKSHCVSMSFLSKTAFLEINLLYG